MKMSEEMAQAVANSIIGIDIAYEPAMPAEDIIILDLLSEGIAESVTESDVRILLGLPRGDRFTCYEA